ncbi:hypothetical protein PR048_023130 [Dryococelus australis]|uniref:Uncharacterized protein n=1 Tax=Dryococelus australis TaxID=614101 RepID=A0ABQ9GT99_9NEOP|nr:hypothetical protein PR048_023130 [Dryococelus australis]
MLVKTVREWNVLREELVSVRGVSKFRKGVEKELVGMHCIHGEYSTGKYTNLRDVDNVAGIGLLRGSAALQLPAGSLSENNAGEASAYSGREENSGVHEEREIVPVLNGWRAKVALPRQSRVMRPDLPWLGVGETPLTRGRSIAEHIVRRAIALWEGGCISSEGKGLAQVLVPGLAFASDGAERREYRKVFSTHHNTFTAKVTQGEASIGRTNDALNLFALPYKCDAERSQQENSTSQLLLQRICPKQGREVTVKAHDKCVLRHEQHAAVGPGLNRPAGQLKLVCTEVKSGRKRREFLYRDADGMVNAFNIETGSSERLLADESLVSLAALRRLKLQLHPLRVGWTRATKVKNRVSDTGATNTHS